MDAPAADGGSGKENGGRESIGDGKVIGRGDARMLMVITERKITVGK